MNGDIQAARKLLSELQEAYGRLPQQLRLRVKCLLCESASPDNIKSSAIQALTSVA